MIPARSLITVTRKDNDVYTYRLSHKPTGVSAEVHSLDFETAKRQCEKDIESKLGDVIERPSDEA